MGPGKIDSPKYAKMVPERIKNLQKKGKLVFPSEHINKKGEKIPAEISSKVMNYNGKKAILSVVHYHK